MPGCSVISDSLQPHGLYPTRLLCPWDFPGKNTAVVAISYTRGSSWPRDRTWASSTGGIILMDVIFWKTQTDLATSYFPCQCPVEALGSPSCNFLTLLTKMEAAMILHLFLFRLCKRPFLCWSEVSDPFFWVSALSWDPRQFICFIWLMLKPSKLWKSISGCWKKLTPPFTKWHWCPGVETQFCFSERHPADVTRCQVAHSAILLWKPPPLLTLLPVSWETDSKDNHLPSPAESDPTIKELQQYLRIF